MMSNETKQPEKKDTNQLKSDHDVVETELEKLQNFTQQSLELIRNGTLLYIFVTFGCNTICTTIRSVSIFELQLTIYI